MDEGLLFILIIPTFVVILPVVISSLILYFILRNKKLSKLGSIIGFIGAAIIGYVLNLFQYVMQITGISGPFIIFILSIALTTLIGLTIIKIFQRLTR